VFNICCALISELKVVSQQKEAEISELKVKIDELKVTAGRDAKAHEELQLSFRQRLHEKQAELEHYRRLGFVNLIFPLFLRFAMIIV